MAAGSVHAQTGQDATAPDALLSKILGTNLSFSANMEIATKMGGQDYVSLPGEIYFARGKARTEMDMTRMKGSKLPPQAVEQMKTMGMSQMISISRPDQQALYMIYPSLGSYAKLALPHNSGANANGVEKTVLGKETVDGHPCEKNRYHLQGSHPGESINLIAWLATDLKGCPVQIEVIPDGANSGNEALNGATLHLTSINPAAPAASLFEPPTGFRVYTDVQAMLQTEILRKMAGTNTPSPHHGTMPPGHP